MKTLVLICGPPAVGKMSVGLELRSITGIPLFHNHMSIEAVLPIFEFGTPPFNRLVSNFREQIFEEAAQSDLPGLIFTYVWAFDRASDVGFVARLAGIFEKHGGRTVFVELFAGQQTRLVRNESPQRLKAKASKRDVAASRQRLLEADSRYQLNSAGDFPFPNHLRIDNTHISPLQAAHRIASHFDLPRVGE